MNFVRSIQSNVEGLFSQSWKQIIQPARQEYSMEDLGERHLRVQGCAITRSDYKVKNRKGEDLNCSLYHPAQGGFPSDVVVFLHGVSSSRLDGANNYQRLVSAKCMFLCFDFSGSGQSGGDYVTYGLKESQDLQAVLDDLSHRYQVRRACLWGRSMGAVTALLYAERLAPLGQVALVALVLDSPFNTIQQIVDSLVRQKLRIPSFLVSNLVLTLKDTIVERTGFNIFSIQTEKTVQHIQAIPALFLYCQADQLIQRDQVESIFSHFASQDKELYLIEGQHQTFRQASTVEYVSRFLLKRLMNRPRSSLDNRSNSYVNIIPSHSVLRLKSPNTSLVQPPRQDLLLKSTDLRMNLPLNTRINQAYLAPAQAPPPDWVFLSNRKSKKNIFDDSSSYIEDSSSLHQLPSSRLSEVNYRPPNVVNRNMRFHKTVQPVPEVSQPRQSQQPAQKDLFRRFFQPT